MKKSLFYQLLVLAVLIVFVSACSQKTAYTNAIPADATVVAAIDLKSLGEKAGIHDNENKEALQKLTDALKSGMNATAFEQVEAILNDPSQSGIDLQAPIYLFTSPAYPQAALAAKVSSEESLKSLLATTEKEQLSTPLDTEGDYSFTLINNSALLAFNASTVLVVGYNNTTQLETVKQAITASLKQTEENSITSKKGFLKMTEMKGDATIYFSFASLPEEYTGQLRESFAANLNWKELMLLGSLSFEKGSVKIVVEPYTENAELKAELEKSRNTSLPIKNSLLGYFPQSSLAIGSIGIDGKELFKTLKENRVLQQHLPQELAGELKNLFEALHSDITMGLISVSMNSTSNFLLLAEAKNGDALKALYEKSSDFKLSKQDEVLKLKENEYVYKSSQMNLFFGIKDKKIYITNDESTYKNIDHQASPSAADCAYAKAIKGQNTAFVLNIEAICAMPIVQMFVQYGGTEAATYFAFCNKIAYFEATGSYEKAQINLQMKDKEVNALKQIVDFVKEFAGM